jgi:hypothetical protein
VALRVNCWHGFSRTYQGREPVRILPEETESTRQIGLLVTRQSFNSGIYSLTHTLAVRSSEERVRRMFSTVFRDKPLVANEVAKACTTLA